MGFDTYDDEHLQRVVEHWRNTPTTPGSMGDRAKLDAEAESECRQALGRRPETGG